MKKTFIFLISCMCLLSFVGNPAPSSLSILELVLIFLPTLIGIGCLAIVEVPLRLYPNQYALSIALLLYLSYLLISSCIGILQGVAFVTMLRSIGPYLIFFPLLMLAIVPRQILSPFTLGSIFIGISFLQISYLSYLYFSHTGQINNTMGVLVNRITFLDPRTTLPYLLVMPLLPVFLFFIQSSGILKKIFPLIAIALIFYGLLASMITLTRSIFLAILLEWLCFGLLFFYYQIQTVNHYSINWSRILKIYLPVFILIFALLSLIPKIQLLELGLVSRFGNEHSQGDYSNGRLYEEWLPAFRVWAHSGLLHWVFGIGAGNAFTLPTGEERTYIHNLMLYSLVYGGCFGFIVTLNLYITLFLSLIARALRNENITYIIFASLLVSLFFYGQLFAVHKVLAFNLMLFLMVVLALEK